MGMSNKMRMWLIGREMTDSTVCGIENIVSIKKKVLNAVRSLSIGAKARLRREFIHRRATNGSTSD